MKTRYPLNLGCTAARHKELGIIAVINARAGLQHLNDQTIEDIELMRDARAIRDRINSRVRFYQFNSKFCRRHIAKLSHLLARHDD